MSREKSYLYNMLHSILRAVSEVNTNCLEGETPTSLVVPRDENRRTKGRGAEPGCSVIGSLAGAQRWSTYSFDTCTFFACE